MIERWLSIIFFITSKTWRTQHGKPLFKAHYPRSLWNDTIVQSQPTVQDPGQQVLSCNTTGGPGAVPNRTLGFGVAAPHDPIHLRVRNDWQRFYKLHKDWCWVMLKPPSTMFWNYVGIILEKSVYFIICWNHTTLPIITLLFYCHEDFMK